MQDFLTQQSNAGWTWSKVQSGSKSSIFVTSIQLGDALWLCDRSWWKFWNMWPAYIYTITLWWCKCKHAMFDKPQWGDINIVTSHLLTFTPSQCDGVNVSMNYHNKHPPLLKICCIIGLLKSHSWEFLCIIPIFLYVTPKGTYTCVKVCYWSSKLCNLLSSRGTAFTR